MAGPEALPAGSLALTLAAADCLAGAAAAAAEMLLPLGLGSSSWAAVMSPTVLAAAGGGTALSGSLNSLASAESSMLRLGGAGCAAYSQKHRTFRHWHEVQAMDVTPV